MNRGTRQPIAEATRWSVLVLIVLVVVLSIGVSFSVARSYKVEQAANRAVAASQRTETSTNIAKDAAIEAKRVLEDAIEQARNGNGVDSGAVIEALSAIHRIELAVCGGPCPEPTGG